MEDKTTKTSCTISKQSATINIDDFSDGEITDNNGEHYWDGTKIFDKMMIAVNGNIKTEYDNGRITGAEYATVYLGALQTVITEASRILLTKQLTEAQINEQLQATEIEKCKLTDQLETSYRQRLQMDAQADAIGREITEKEATGKAQRKQMDAQADAIKREITEKELTGAKQREQIDVQVDVAEREITEKELTGVKQRLQMDAQVDVAEREITEKELTGVKQRLQMDAQTDAIKREIDEKEATGAKQREHIEAQIDIAEREITEKEATGAKQREILKVQRLTEKAKKELTERQKDAFDDSNKAKIFEAAINGWALAYSSGAGVTSVPTIVNNDNISTLANNLTGIQFDTNSKT